MLLNQIKNYLQNIYENPVNGGPIPSFVLLVGDTQQIPPSYASGDHVSDLIIVITQMIIYQILCGRFSAQNLIMLTHRLRKIRIRTIQFA